MSIAHVIQSFGQPAWPAIIFDWLSKFEGMECFLWEEEDPCIQTMQALSRFLKERKIAETIRADELARVLTAQRFLLIRAKYLQREWQSTTETFQEFLQAIAPAQYPDLWEASSPLPSQAIHEQQLTELMTSVARPGGRPLPPKK